MSDLGPAGRIVISGIGQSTCFNFRSLLLPTGIVLRMFLMSATLSWPAVLPLASIGRSIMSVSSLGREDGFSISSDWCIPEDYQLVRLPVCPCDCCTVRPCSYDLLI